MLLQYLIANLGMSLNFGGKVDLKHLPFPATMRIDYVRVYQRSDQKNVGCDPKDFPTQAYINRYAILILNSSGIQPSKLVPSTADISTRTQTQTLRHGAKTM